MHTRLAFAATALPAPALAPAPTLVTVHAADAACPHEERIAQLLLAVEALLRHTGCPSPFAPWRPQTMQAWLT